jgi:hypothetical protein
MPPNPLHKQIAYFPYIGLAGVDEISDGSLVLWNADKRLDPYVPDRALREQVRALLDMNRVSSRGDRVAGTVRGIGVVSIGAHDFRPFSPRELRRVGDFRIMLFLATLSENAKSRAGANAGHSIYTSENFDLLIQGFALGSRGVSERTGVIVDMMIGGYSMDNTSWIKPGYVHLPLSFRLDQELFNQLKWLRANNTPQYRRVVRAGRVFLGSYYNAQNVDMNARILLQVMAFEILLDLPEWDQRKVFKERLEKLCWAKGDRRRSFKSERPGGKTAIERRTVKGIWADRLYTLRNHIIHGNVVRESEYVFRGQSHIVAAPVVFVGAVRRVIDAARKKRGKNRVFLDDLRWARWKDEIESPPKQYRGFVIDIDVIQQLRELIRCQPAST